MKRYYLRKDKIKELKKLLPDRFQPLADKLGENVEVVEHGGAEVVISNEKPIFILREKPIPALTAVEQVNLPKIVVDMGAVGPMCRGADVMAPGVRDVIGEVLAGDLVVIVDERHRKPLAVGEALVFGSLIKGEKGRVIKNLHHIGDEFWKIFSSLKDTKVK